MDKSNKWIKVNLYMLSLSILFICILVAKIEIGKMGTLKYWIENYIIFFCTFGLLWSIYSLFYLHHLSKGSLRLPKTVSKEMNINYENLSFLTSYLVPLISISEQFVVIILICTVAIMQIKANLFYTNPILVIFGFQLYRVQFENDDMEYIVIIRECITKGDRLNFLHINHNVLYAKNLKRR